MRREETKTSAAGGWVYSACAVVFKIGALVFALVAAYLVYAVVSGQLRSDLPASGVALLSGAGKVLLVSGVLASACLAFVTVEEVYWSVVGGVVGLILLFGVPALVANYAQSETPAATAVAFWGTLTAKALIIIAALRVLYEIYRSLVEGSERRKEPEDEARRAREKLRKPPRENVFARCWQMPFCHDAVRELCPAFKARKSCWKFGKGCNCDPDLVETLIRSRAAGPSRQARATEAAFIRSELEADTVRRRSERTIPCAKCPIFTEHQRRKFRVINPLLILGTLVLIVVLYEPLGRVYSALARGIAGLIAGTALNPATGGNVQWWYNYLDTPTLQTAFVVIVGLFCLSWILKVGEWLVLEKKVV